MTANKHKTLAGLASGEEGKVVAFECGNGMSCRLESMGIRIGSVIRKMSAQSMRGPITVKIGNTSLALGHGIASKITVEPVK